MPKHRNIGSFRQILIWPLALEHPDLQPGAGSQTIRSTAEIVKGEIDRLMRGGAKNGALWKSVPDKAHYLKQNQSIGANSDQSDWQYQANLYAEQVYFHRFVQTFLYDDDDAVTLFARTDIARVEVAVSSRASDGSGLQDTFDLNVERCHLYLFSLAEHLPPPQEEV